MVMYVCYSENKIRNNSKNSIEHTTAETTNIKYPIGIILLIPKYI